jgi:hypothetical protein
MDRLIIIFLLLTTCSISAQQDLTLYQLSGIPQMNMVNPAVFPESKIVVGIPVISSINVNYNNFSFSVDDGFLIDGNTLVVDFEHLVNELNNKNYIYNQEQDQWFMFGYVLGENYFEIAISDILLVDLTFPKSIFELALQGNAAFLDQKVSIEGLGLDATNYREISLGYARKLGKWDVGIHANLLFGLANIYTRASNVGIYTDAETFDITIDGKLEVNTSGLDNIDDFGNYITRMVNNGFGVDLGAVYKPVKQWEFSMSILDLGFIKWTKDVKSYVNNENSVTLSGIDIKDYLEDGDLDSDSLIQVIKDSISDLFSFDEFNDPYTTPLTPKWYFGAKYKFTEKHRVYTTFNLQFFRAGLRPAFALGYEFKLQQNFGLTVSYSIISGSYANVGFGLQVKGGPVQIYLMSDNLLAAFNAFNYQAIHYRFGINLLFGKKKNRRNTPAYLR